MILTVNVGGDWGRDTNENLDFLPGLFDFLEDTGSSATVFLQSKVAEKISDLGVPDSVELASLGVSGKSFGILTEDEIAEEIAASKKSLESIFKTKVLGFRTPDFFCSEELWPFLKVSGYVYSSSLSMGKKYKEIKFDAEPFEKEGIMEFPLQKTKIFPKTFNFHFFRRFYPFSKFFVPENCSLFSYDLTELLQTFPGSGLSWKKRLNLSINRGRKARKILYPFLEKNAPTSSIKEALKL